MTGKPKWLLAPALIGMLLIAASVRAAAPTPLLIAYGGHNETMVPLWVGIEKGLFRKYGVDPRVLQTRSGPIMMATLVSGGTPLVWAAPSSALSTTASGLKLGCFAVGNNRVPREVIARKGIETLEDLHGKSFGVGIVDALAYILDPANKRDVSEVLKKNLRLSKDEDIEASYRVSRLQMPNLDVGPNVEAWRTVKRLVAKVNPKVQDVDLDQVLMHGPAQNLEATGFLAEMRKRLPR